MILFAVIDGETRTRIAQFFEEDDATWFIEHPPEKYKTLIVEATGSVG